MTEPAPSQAIRGRLNERELESITIAIHECDADVNECISLWVERDVLLKEIAETEQQLAAERARADAADARKAVAIKIADLAARKYKLSMAAHIDDEVYDSVANEMDFAVQEYLRIVDSPEKNKGENQPERSE